MRRFLNFGTEVGSYEVLPAHLFLEDAGASPTCQQALPPAMLEKLEGRVVIIADATGNDVRPTPLGLMDGAEIQAVATANLLHGDLVPEVDRNGALLIGLHLLSIVLVVMFNQLPPKLALAANVVGIPSICVVGSYVLYLNFYHWVNFLPLCIGVIIHHLYEQAAEIEKLKAGGHVAPQSAPRPLP
jgi:CHASE2 domain-containing sensor protein